MVIQIRKIPIHISNWLSLTLSKLYLKSIYKLYNNSCVLTLSDPRDLITLLFSMFTDFVTFYKHT